MSKLHKLKQSNSRNGHLIEIISSRKPEIRVDWLGGIQIKYDIKIERFKYYYNHYNQYKMKVIVTYGGTLEVNLMTGETKKLSAWSNVKGTTQVKKVKNEPEQVLSSESGVREI